MRFLLSLLFLSFSFCGAADYDVIIRNASILDGSGGPEQLGAVAVKEGKIAAVGAVTGSAEQEVDAGGLSLAPGFVDVHTHSEDICQIPAAENFLRMGVTTIITGNCGAGRTDVGKFFREMEGAKLSLNVATLIGHGDVRREAMGGVSMRAPTEPQLARMKELIHAGMKAGAVGLSTGLIYVPGSFAKTPELIACARAAGEHGGIYVSHMRYETVRIPQAIEELVTIAREAKVKAQVSHIKLSGPSAWGQATQILESLDKARAEGLDIAHDQYAYTASSTGLRQLIPDKALEGTRSEINARLEDPKQKPEIIAEMKAMLERQGRVDFRHAVIARYSHDSSLNGISVPAAAKLKRGTDSFDDQVELVLDIERHGGASAIFHGMSDADVSVFMKHPLTMIASDGGPRRLGADVPHPRSYGNNARVLGRYVRDEKLISLPEAIRRMTSLPAERFQLGKRGRIMVGHAADMVLFDLSKVKDPSTFGDPHHYSEGFHYVWVAGRAVIEKERLTAARPGGPLRMAKGTLPKILN
jgi:N-acyl-D-amino-acid deacylase